jgi:hypothetical protein
MLKNGILPIMLTAILVTQWSCKSNNGKTEQIEGTPPMELTLTPFEASQEYADAAINSMEYEKGKFNFKISGNYQLGQQTPDAPQKMCANSDKGQHIHLIVDNKPYEAKYEPSFNFHIDDGDHYVLAFLSRSYHESIKSNQAFVLVNTSIKDSTFKKVNPVNIPMIFYSRPKGNYIGEDTKKVMLDFYLANCTLGSQYKVKANINGTDFVIDNWQPYYLEGLPMGENTIQLTLIDSAGVAVASPLNPVERKFTLQADPSKQ